MKPPCLTSADDSPSRIMRRATLCMLRLLVPLVALLGRSAAAQGTRGSRDSATAPSAACGYGACALSIAPRWSGLAVVRGAAGPQVTNLYFLWPRDIGAALVGADARVPGADSALASAQEALRLRRVGAVLTNASLALATGAAIRAARGDSRGWDRRLLGLASAALVVSVPFHFAADGALSRAVWWHNQRYAR